MVEGAVTIVKPRSTPRSAAGQKNFLKMRKDLADHPIEKVGKELRAMMPWIGKNKLVDKDKN